MATPRQRAHAQTIEDIKRIARDQLAAQGSSGLSLRAIARELGIVSSAIYRYVPSRDELLTLLIIDAYNSLADAATAADRRCRRDDHYRRWMAIGRAVRRWALERPTEYALLYGWPAPGYKAPQQTIDPGSRVTLMLIELFVGAHAAGVEPPAMPSPAIPSPVARDLADLKAGLGITIDDELLARGMLAWTSLYGMISFELFGQYVGGIHNTTAYFDHQLARLALLVGLSE